MGLLNGASGDSVWNGYNYYDKGRVLSCEQTAEDEFSGQVQGEKTYSVKINFQHSRKSACNCPHTNGRRIICKHMIALYFTAFPTEAERFVKNNEQWERKEEERNEKVCRRVEVYVQKMPVKQIREELYRLLTDSPSWIFDRFVCEHNLDYTDEKENSYIDEDKLNRLTRTVQECFESADGEMTFYYNKQLNRIVLDSPYSDVRTVDDCDDNFLRLPDKRDVDEYGIMQEFALKQTENIRCELMATLSGKGVYRRFKDAVLKLHIEKFWYAYRDENFRLIAEDWCRKNIF